MDLIRTFVAAPVPAEVRRALSEIQDRLKGTEADVRWEAPEKFHMTLKFLGDVDPAVVDALTLMLGERFRDSKQLDIAYEALGAFPNLQAPRILWIGARANRHLTDMQSAVETVCIEAGFSKDERLFHPHITVGRVKGTRNLHRLTDAIKTVTFQSIESSCPAIALMRSDLSPGGSSYTTLKSYPLQP